MRKYAYNKKIFGRKYWGRPASEEALDTDEAILRNATPDKRAKIERKLKMTKIMIKTNYYPGQKKTIPKIRGEKNTVRSCDTMLDHERSEQGKVISDYPLLLPCADHA